MTYRSTHSVFHVIALCASLVLTAAAPVDEDVLVAEDAVLAEEVAVVEDVDPIREAPPYRRFHVGTSLFVLLNLAPLTQPPSFANVNVGVRLTPKDVLIFEAITWQYWEPLGVPYGPDKGRPGSAFPGRAVDVGVGVAYQRFLWKGAYVGLHATPFYQIYLDEQGKRIQSGFQLFTTARAGYHFAFAKNRVFLEPSVAFTAWPINTNLPDAFAAQEDRWPSYFLFEPGLHFGVKF